MKKKKALTASVLSDFIAESVDEIKDGLTLEQLIAIEKMIKLINQKLICFLKENDAS